MGISKTKKATKALQERVDTIDLNGDMIRRAVGEETYEETVKCRNEIKALIDGSEAKSKQIGQMRKKIAEQNWEIEKLRKKIDDTESNRIKMPGCCRECPMSRYSRSDREYKAWCTLSGELLEFKSEKASINPDRTRFFRGERCPLEGVKRHEKNI